MLRNLLLAALVVSIVGCVSRLTGNEGNFEFSYPADDRVADFNKPLAVGAFLDLQVRDVGRRQPVQLSSASFDDEAVLSVVNFAGNNITIQGMGDGTALLSVEGTTATNETLTDSVNMLARVPEVLLLHHTCRPSEGIAHYLTDQRIWVPFEMQMANTQPVIGYGYYPVTLGGSAATLNEDQSNQQWLAIDTGTAAGPVTVDSDLDDTMLTLDVVTEASIDGIAEPIAFVLEDIDVGDRNPFYVLPTVAGVTVCQAEVTKTVTSDTPTICAVRDRQSADLNGDASKEFGWFEIEGLATGTCQYTVTYPGGAGGTGVSAQFEYPIQP